MVRSRKINRKAEIVNRLREKVARKKGEKKICLVAIMKNESKNVDRLLDSFLDKESGTYIIDMISVVDTGSTDNTEELILRWGKNHSIPTTVHHELFVNFAYNRTHSVKVAKETYPEADYFLLSDADFVWCINIGGKFDKTLLIDHQYKIKQSSKYLTYWNIRMLSSKVEWVCEGVTHESWVHKKDQKDYFGQIRTTDIKTLMIDDKEDGGCKGDKFQRDERLLREGLEDPTTEQWLRTRYKFYLAQTLRDLGKYLDSIEWYKKRIEDKGWDEEVFYSKYQIGLNYCKLFWNQKYLLSIFEKSEKSEDEEKMLCEETKESLIEKADHYFKRSEDYFLEAYNFRKTRAEPIYHLTEMYRKLGKNEQAYLYAMIGKNIKFPEDSLFVERQCYEFLFDFEISICAFYIPGKKHEGREAISRLLQRDDLPEDIIHMVENNSRHYL